jgi:hypothetical protein
VLGWRPQAVLGDRVSGAAEADGTAAKWVPSPGAGGPTDAGAGAALTTLAVWRRSTRGSGPGAAPMPREGPPATRVPPAWAGAQGPRRSRPPAASPVWHPPGDVPGRPVCPIAPVDPISALPLLARPALHRPGAALGAGPAGRATAAGPLSPEAQSAPRASTRPRETAELPAESPAESPATSPPGRSTAPRRGQLRARRPAPSRRRPGRAILAPF